MEELIKKLRDADRRGVSPPQNWTTQAADALEAQQARIAELRGLIPTEIPGNFIRFGKNYAESKEAFFGMPNPMTKFKMEYWNSCRNVLNRTDDLSALSELKAGYEARIAELFLRLSTMFEAYENGPDCYEDPDECAGHLGKAVHLDNEDFHRIADILNAGETFDALATHDAEIYKQGRACGIAEAAEGKVVMFSREGLAAHDAEVRNKAIDECAKGAETFHDDCYCYKHIDMDGYELARRMRSLKEQPK